MKKTKVLTSAIALGALCCVCPTQALAGAGLSVQAVQQAQKITGTVIDEMGEPMIGVTVKLKGTSAATVTDLDGNFVLNSPTKGGQLELSYVGYKVKTVPVGNGVVNVTMDPDSQVMDEVVVIGYGTAKKRDLTGAVTSMKSEDITIAPTSNAMEALQGKIAGMDIAVTSGQIGQDPQILLRGSRSIYGDNSPLFIIDGVPGSYSQVNPSDIESIDVLKDASSTAIYGSAGANGVVMITTKRGKEGKATVNFDAYYGFSGTPNYKHGMVGDEWVRYQKEAYKYKYGNDPENMAVIFNNDAYLQAYEAGKWIDWVDEVSGSKATTQKYSMSVNGGGQKTKIYAALSYTKDQGLLENEKQDMYQMRLNIDQEIFSWAKMGFTSNLTYRNRDAGVKNTFTKALSAFPLGDAYNEDGSIRHEFINNQYTPLGDFIEDQYANNTRATYLNTTGYLELTPLKGLSFRSQLSATLSTSRQGQYWGAQCNANRPTYAQTPHAAVTHNDNWSYLWENILNYKITVAKDHDFGATFVTSWQKTQSEMTLASGSGQDMDKWSFHRLMSAQSQHIESDFTQTQKMSYAIRFNYSYKGKYLLNISNRWDGVSWFSDGNKWDSFFASALAWRISDEAFMEGTRSWLDNLKLRVGYGITGNSGGVGAYATTTTPYVYTASGVTVNGRIAPFAQYTGTVASAALGWEKSYNWNFGLDFAVLNSRIDGSFEYFTTKTKGLLYSRTVPMTSGFSGWGSPLKMWQNLAKTSNHGFEATINSHNIRTKDFTWNTSLSVTWSKEQIDELPEGDIIAESLFEGQPIKTKYGYKYVGLWKTTDDEELMGQYGVKPGYIKIETIEKDGDGGVHKYGEDDRQILGHQNPDWIFGLNNQFTYKGFDLSVFLMARLGQTIQSDLLTYYTAKDDLTTNQLAGADYWTEDHQDAFYPRPGTGNEQSTVYNALQYHDGSFVKLKNVTLGYTLPQNISRKALMEKLRFYFTAYNPVIWAKSKQLRGTDPEMNGSDAFPTYRQFVFGVNVTF
ncbi:MAG: TonB-dependent receptor [Prevotella sp.]|nr:TonB-dependent receptor [Prevotella sp.]